MQTESIQHVDVVVVAVVVVVVAAAAAAENMPNMQ